jgi:hypothetical protein
MFLPSKNNFKFITEPEKVRSGTEPTLLQSNVGMFYQPDTHSS